MTILRAAAAADTLRVRYRAAFPFTPDASVATVRRYTMLRDSVNGPWLRFGIAKGMLDGTVDAKTAAMLEPYVGSDDTGLPFWPAATETILAASPDEPASLPNPPVADLLEECREKWEQQKFGGGPPDAESPNTRFAFRGCPDPFALTDSDPSTDFLPEPGQPLSWRILQYLRAWCQKAGLPLS